MSKTKQPKEFMDDDRWKRKGGPHRRPDLFDPKPCPSCMGLGVVFNPVKSSDEACGTCDGLGEVE